MFKGIYKEHGENGSIDLSPHFTFVVDQLLMYDCSSQSLLLLLLLEPLCSGCQMRRKRRDGCAWKQARFLSMCKAVFGDRENMVLDRR
jgi:hypothetical protein